MVSSLTMAFFWEPFLSCSKNDFRIKLLDPPVSRQTLNVRFPSLTCTMQLKPTSRSISFKGSAYWKLPARLTRSRRGSLLERRAEA